MPPSTVFSYLRRDHRRLSPSSATTSPSTSSPPQLPVTLPKTKLTDSIFEASPWTESKEESRLDNAPELLKVPDIEPVQNVSSPRPAIGGSRPQSSSGEGLGPLSSLTGVQRCDQHDSGQHRGISSWKRGFGGQKPSAVPGASTGGIGKGKASDTLGGTPFVPIKELKSESSSFRRESGYDSALEPPSSRGGKMRFHLLNPMALLARRRSTQFNTRAEDINVGKLTLPALPDDYDPRIRGNLFHDFSVPRPRPNPVSSTTQPGYSGDASFQTEEAYFSDSYAQASCKNRQFGHQPIFKENFDDGSAKETHQELAPQPEGTCHSLPVFARHLPSALPARPEYEQREAVPIPLPATAHEEAFTSLRSKPPTIRDSSSQAPSGLPKHLTSSASRFSFDLAGGDSASQERLLEEKHKEKEAARKAKEQSIIAADDFEFEEFDYDAMIDDDGLEEKIPGVNADAEEYEDEGGIPNTLHPLRLLPVTTSFLQSSTNSQGVASSQSPQPQETFPMAGNTMLVPNICMTSEPTTLPPLVTEAEQPFLAPVQQAPQMANRPTLSHAMDHDDDLYYDDGMFDDLPEDMQDGDFDESIFDDEASHLYEQKNKGNNGLSPILEKRTVTEHVKDLRGSELPAEDAKEGSETRAPRQLYDLKADGRRESVQELTHGNIQAYQDALAQAANEAALKGRFQRRFSGSEESNGHDATSGTDDSHPNLTAGQSRHTSQNVDIMAIDEAFDDFKFYDVDDIDDDPIIAAANAEVLENDDEGFYGQEFGFYAHSHPHCDNERVFGGYFGTKGMERVKRSHSGRANFREPSLTPITERSEWSTRNSIVSLAPHPGSHSNPSNPSISSPPLSQLVDMGNFDDDISFGALMKLRRGAFGGSNGSLHSNAPSHTGQSPQSPSIPPGSSNFGSFSSFQNVLSDQKRVGGVTNSPGGLSSPPWSDNSFSYQGDVESPASRFGLWSDAPLRIRSSERPHSMNMESLPANKARSPDVIRRHVRSNSATESISYVKETDESGANCWVLERRKTGDDGEFVEREVMSSGHI
ncbi:hypothetical protein PRK78_006222 [Emydomyces testavorans]|uniref:AGC-kinase C-terminal domain-containing protein n=1 Tax=Emydomyces testavorans TaxID=2070801 RepID=A0AAF0DL05_9EURO|nr:hypothetical protein PRK78_006222 [Emydomyces testavorans]